MRTQSLSAVVSDYSIVKAGASSLLRKAASGEPVSLTLDELYQAFGDDIDEARRVYAVEGDHVFGAQSGAMLRHLALRYLERGVNRSTITACVILAWMDRREDWRIAGCRSFAEWADKVNPFDWGSSQAYRAVQIGDLIINGLYDEKDLAGVSFTALREALPVMTRAYGDQDVSDAWRAFLAAFFRCNPSTSDVQELRRSRIDAGWEKVYRALGGNVEAIIELFGFQGGERPDQLSFQLQRYALISHLVEANEASDARSLKKLLTMLADASDAELYYLGALPERESAASSLAKPSNNRHDDWSSDDGSADAQRDPFAEDRRLMTEAIARAALSSLSAHDNYSIPRIVVERSGGDWYRISGEIPVSTLLVLAAHVRLVDEDGNPFRFHDESSNEEEPCHH